MFVGSLNRSRPLILKLSDYGLNRNDFSGYIEPDFPVPAQSCKMDAMSTDLPSQIHSELDGLDADKKRPVLAYVRTLKQTSTGHDGR
jgi:hypothetical protein